MFNHFPPIKRSILALIIVVSLVSACALPSASTPQPTSSEQTPEAIYTSAVQTVIAQLTQSAPTSIPIEVQFTPTMLPATATQSPTNTQPPSATPTKITPTATVVPTSTSVPTDPKLNLGNPTWKDTFTSDQNWSLSADEHTDMIIKDGKLILTALHPDGWDGWALTWPKTVNFYLEMTATPGTCSGLDRYGVMVRAKSDATEGYLFGFSCDGKYSFRKWDGKSFTKIVDWTSSQAILANANQTNRLGVMAKGDKFSLYANGKLLTEVQDKTYDNGNFGVFVGAKNTANFTVQVSELDYWELP